MEPATNRHSSTTPATTSTMTNHHPVNSSSNDQKVRFQLDRSLSCDSSIAADVAAAANSTSNIDIDSNVKNLDKLSPKLKTFFSFDNNNPKFHGIQNIDERFPVGYSNGRAGKKFLPTQLLNGGGDESLTSDGGSSASSILHNIFSPKFHAQSAKKKKKKKLINTELKDGYRQQSQQVHRNPHHHQQHQQHSIFSPMSATSTPGRGQQYNETNNTSIISEMSDEFSTIHAILRGDTLKDYRKTVGWEAACHPLRWSDSDDVMSESSPTIDKEYPRDPHGEVELESKVENVDSSNNDNMQYQHHQVRSYCNNDIDDSTEVMLEMAIRMTSPENANNHTNNTTKTPGKRPSSMNNDEFHTPSSSIKPGKSSPVMVIPLAVESDLDNRILGGLLPPVSEEGKGYNNRDSRQLDASTSSSMDMKDFRTPKQHGKMDHYDENDSDNNDDEEEEEFFSPLAAHTASFKKHDTSNLNSNTINTLVSTLTAIDFTNYATTVPSKMMTLSSSRNSAQLLTNKANDPTPPEATTAAFTVFHEDYPQDALHSCTSSHLHSPRVSTLSPDALTIDYIKSCVCLETLNTIHSLLTDVNNVTIHRNNHGKRGKQLRYPSLVRLVERQLQRLQQDEINKEQYQQQQHTISAGTRAVQLLPRVAQGKVLDHSLEDSDGGSDKENVNPRQPFIHDDGHQTTTAVINEPNRASPIPMQCISVLYESSVNQHGSPGSFSMSRSSLDMNLSESMMFALDDESHYWRQDGATDNAESNSNQNQGGVELAVHSIEEKAMTAEHFDKQSQTFDQDCILESYVELEDKLAMTLSANVILTSEVDSLVNEQQEIKAELSAKLEHMTKQLSRQQDIAASESITQRAQIAELDRINHSLREEIEHLYRQLHIVNHNAENTALQLQSEIEDAKNKWSNHSSDKESLNKELIEIRSRYEKLLHEKKTATLSKETHKLRLFAESAKLANAALANSLAVSEKDLAEANAAREKSERECDALRKHVVRLEDKASFLSAKLKEMGAELQSGHAYIDKLYAELQQIEVSSEDLKIDFERREMEWIELEQGYSQRIRELEDKYGSESKNKVSLEAYMTVVKQTRHYKAEATKNQETIDSLKERLAAGKAMRALQVIGVSKPIHCNSQIGQQGGVVSKSDTQQEGKHLNRVAVIRAAGGRKGLTEQLKRARGVSPKANNVPSFTL